MSTATVLRKALESLEGLTFPSGQQQLFDDKPEGIYGAFITTNRQRELTHEQAARNILATITTLFKVCRANEDTYRRLLGGAPFWYLIMVEWNPQLPLEPAQIQGVVELFVDARKRYLAEETHDDTDDDGRDTDDDNDEEVSTSLTIALDRYIIMTDDVNSSRRTRQVPSLNQPQGVDLAALMANTSLDCSVWPPARYTGLDVAILAEKSVRRQLFGINRSHHGGDDQQPVYPHDQDLPLVVRSYLCHLSLTEQTAASKSALFLAPVAFTTHQQRQAWYGPTGHQSRFYATVGEFVEYARVQFDRAGSHATRHVLCLLSPWYFNRDAFLAGAVKKRDEASVPTVWEKTCFRAGAALCMTRLKKYQGYSTYRVTLFRPGPPSHHLAAELLGRREKQIVWVDEMLDIVDETFTVTEGWQDGSTKVYDGSVVARGVFPDSVELASQFITETIEDDRNMPTDSEGFLERRFKVIPRYLPW